MPTRPRRRSRPRRRPARRPRRRPRARARPTTPRTARTTTRSDQARYGHRAAGGGWLLRRPEPGRRGRGRGRCAISGWDGLLNIIQLNRDEQRAWADAAPQACPHDGEPLVTGPDGDLRCPGDGWIWDGTTEGKRGTA